MRTFIAAVVLALVLLPLPALAADLHSPTGPVVLTVSGDISNTNVEQTAQFDLAMLDALAQRTSVVDTPWYEGTQTFSGLLAAAILDAVGAKGSTITVTALNGYSADIPVDDLVETPVILASRHDGSLMSVRDKGPLFVVYPFDVRPDFYNEVYFGRSVWQVTSLSVH